MKSINGAQDTGLRYLVMLQAMPLGRWLTLSAIAAKHGARLIYDRAEHAYIIELKDGTPIELPGDRLREHTTASLEALITRKQEVQP